MQPKPTRPRLAGKTVKIKPDRVKSLQRRHPWIFSGAVASIPDRPAGSIVDVTGPEGEFIARGFFNPESQIILRVLSWIEAEKLDDSFFRGRLLAAFGRRKEFASTSDSNAWRLFNSESDGIPGLIIDQFNDSVIIQSTTAGVDLHLESMIESIKSLRKPRYIIERSNDTNRKREGLDLRERQVFGDIPPNHEVAFIENGIRFALSLESGHKTGYYLDQKVNRDTVGRLCRDGDVLDTFCYSGGFTLNALKHGARSVVTVDSSQPALDLLQKNIAMNHFAERNVEVVCADVFDQLRTLRELKKSFDVVILDPPKLARSAANATKAARAYQDLSRIGFELLRPGGYLATFSCSGHMPLDLFQKVIFAAANQSNSDVHLQKIMLQAPDHPVHLNIPESLYLKGLLCRKNN